MLFQREQAGLIARESPHTSDQMIPSGDFEQPIETSDADDAVEDALAPRHGTGGETDVA